MIIKYLGKNVILTDIHEKKYIGQVKYYNPLADSDENLAELVLDMDARAIFS